jgi:hypothetical protein
VTALTAALGVAALLAGTAQAAVSCPPQTLDRPFLPWLDPASYVLLDNGSLEDAGGWTLAGGATLAAGNEPWRVHGAGDASALSLPSGSSATSPPLCTTLFHPTLRFFAANGGSPLSLLKVEAIATVAGVRLTLPVAVLPAGSAWQPTAPLPFLDFLLAPLTGPVQFRFTPVGLGPGGWRVDDVYVDPFKNR